MEEISPRHETVQIKSFKEYLNFIGDLGDSFTQELCLFRGQLCDKPLIPKLGRLALDNIKEFETRLFSDFQKRYLAYSKKKL